MLTALRKAVQACLENIPASRKPALRRSDDPDALLATDLPLVAQAGDAAAFAAAMEQAGWRVWEKNGWLLLDHAVPAPVWRWPGEYPGEWGCCLWLLRQHGNETAPAEMIRALVKAAEQGRDKVERLCAQWHGLFAEMLRNRRELPGGLAPYLCAAMKEDAE